MALDFTLAEALLNAGYVAEAAEVNLSLAKRARELMLGLPGLLYLHLSERAGARTVRAAPP